MAAIACDDVGNLHRLMNAGEALIIVRVPGEDGVRPDARFLANRADLRQHLFAPPVVVADCIGGMMVRQNQRAGERLCARQRGLEKIQLRVPEFLGRNDAGSSSTLE